MLHTPGDRRIAPKDLMAEAISWMEKSTPDDPTRTPKVGAIVAVGDEVIARAYRGKDDHAEKRALEEAASRCNLSHATVYTTLEPCTSRVRTQPGESCTERLVSAQVRKVFIGILDPNQGVCGKGVLALQNAKIEVELFPHDFAQHIRQVNEPFIRAQQRLGVIIRYPGNGETVRGRKCNISGKFVNEPGDNVVAITNIGDQWWPQPGTLRVATERDREWECTVYFGLTGVHKIYIVKANDLGMAFVEYYRKVIVKQGQILKKVVAELKVSEATALAAVGSGYFAFTMPTLPKGLDMEDCITVDVRSLDA
jgi:diaminohydroxyphosphoribosylaminopyrimidine deaminase/5-amino-6-(5-phosphoribosylamino)uracil reductase